MKQVCHHEDETDPPKTYLGCFRFKYMPYGQRLQFPTFSLIHTHRARPYKGRIDVGVCMLICGWMISFTPFTGRDAE